MFEAGIPIDKVEYNATAWNKPNRRKANNKKKNSKALRKMLRTVRQVVLDTCFNPNQVYHVSWAANAADIKKQN